VGDLVPQREDLDQLRRTIDTVPNLNHLNLAP
jgi:hypothetical protein